MITENVQGWSLADGFLFMADSHIKARTWTNTTLLSGDAYAALDLLASELAALDRPPRTLVIGGDWFDGQRPLSTDLLATKRFAEIFDRVLYIRGNHDRNDPSYLENELGGTPVTHIHGRLITDGAAGLAGVDWQSSRAALLLCIKECLETAAAAGLSMLYLVLHASTEHLLAFEGAWQLSLKDIAGMCPEGLQVIALIGDIHTIDMTTEGPVTCISPGSLYPLSLDKMTDDTYCGAVLVKPDSIDLLPAVVRHYRSVDYSDHVHLGADCARLAAEFADDRLQPFVAVHVPPELAGADIRTSEFPGVAMQALLHRASGAAAADTSVATPANYTLADAVNDECGQDATLAALANTLLVSDDPTAEIGSWLDSWKVERLA